MYLVPDLYNEFGFPFFLNRLNVTDLTKNFGFPFFISNFIEHHFLMFRIITVFQDFRSYLMYFVVSILILHSFSSNFIDLS